MDNNIGQKVKQIREALKKDGTIDEGMELVIKLYRQSAESERRN